MNKIVILSGTDRPNSKALQISEYIKPLLEANGAEVNIVSLEDYPTKDVAGGKYGQDIASVEEFNQRALDCDGLIMVIPEYNGSFPGILKLFIDYLPFPKAFEKLPIAFIGEAAGAFGALRPVEQMQMICNYRNAFLFPERIFIQRVNKIFDKEEGLKDEFTSKLLNQQLENFISFIERNKEVRVEVEDFN